MGLDAEVEQFFSESFVGYHVFEQESGDARFGLDLSGLESADKRGIKVLRSLGAEGAELHDASLYNRHFLKEKMP